jgi:hypothetical protein
MPAKAGIQNRLNWVAAFAGMTRYRRFRAEFYYGGRAGTEPQVAS